jgi:hypothetical protein
MLNRNLARPASAGPVWSQAGPAPQLTGRGVVPLGTSCTGRGPHSPKLTSHGHLRYYSIPWVLPGLLRAGPGPAPPRQATRALISKEKSENSTDLLQTKTTSALSPQNINPETMEEPSRDRKLHAHHFRSAVWHLIASCVFSPALRIPLCGETAIYSSFYH